MLLLQLVQLFPWLGTNQNSLPALQDSRNKSRSSYTVNPADVGQFGINIGTDRKYHSARAYYNCCCEVIWSYSLQSCQSVSVLESPVLNFRKKNKGFRTPMGLYHCAAYSASARSSSSNNAVHPILMIKVELHLQKWSQIIFACSTRLWFLHLRFSNWITKIRTIIWLILWHIRGLKYHQDIFISNVRKQSLLHYSSQQTVYTKRMIEYQSYLNNLHTGYVMTHSVLQKT